MRVELSKENYLYVNDLVAAERFYGDIMGLTVSNRAKDQYSLFHYDDGTLILFQTQTIAIEPEDMTFEADRLGQVSLTISHADISSWRKHLQQHNVLIEAEISWPNGVQSLTFRDPAGNRIQLQTQLQDFQDVTKEEQIRKVSDGGFNSKWKLYQAVKLAGQTSATSDD